jgi:hypothetical protein
MNIILMDNVIKNPDTYVERILKNDFYDIQIGEQLFKGIQQRPYDDEFARFATQYFPEFVVVYNFVRKSPIGQEEPNFIHSDEMMGDVTLILYLNKEHPKEDGTTIYEEDGSIAMTAYSKYNRVFGFESNMPHSRNIYQNFGEGDSSRLIQVIFLKYIPDEEYKGD